MRGIETSAGAETSEPSNAWRDWTYSEVALADGGVARLFEDGSWSVWR